MSLSDHLLKQLDAEIDASRRVLERVPESGFDWRPHEKSWTMKDLATHVAVLVGWGGMILTTDGIDFQSDDMKKWAPPTAESVEDILGILESNAQKAREALAGMSDEALEENWVMRAGEHVMASDPRYDTFCRWVLSHQSHHRGQLTVYLRTNDVPLPAIFGPSADEEGGM